MRMLPANLNRVASIPCLLVIGLFLSGCASRPEWTSIAWFETSTEPIARSENIISKLPTPENLRAISGELRAIPLAWEPLLTADIAGYVVERAASLEGPFEPIAEIAGRLETTCRRGPSASLTAAADSPATSSERTISRGSAQEMIPISRPTFVKASREASRCSRVCVAM